MLRVASVVHLERVFGFPSDPSVSFVSGEFVKLSWLGPLLGTSHLQVGDGVLTFSKHSTYLHIYIYICIHTVYVHTKEKNNQMTVASCGC